MQCRWNTIGTNFQDHKDISTFNEFSKFTSVTKLYVGAFYRTSLREATIPVNVAAIEAGAFRNITNALTVTCLPTTPPTLGSNAFGGTTITAIYVPASAVDAYKTDSAWSVYAAKISAIPQ